MPNKNRASLVIGFILIGFSFLCIVGLLYFIGSADRKKTTKIDYLQTQLVNLIGEKSAAHMSASDYRRIQRKPVEFADVLTKNEKVYSKEELDRKEGALWIDRASLKAMVTLGAANGLTTASHLNVYDGDNVVGEVAIESVLDVISYVKPVDKSFGNFDKDYYRVAVKK